MAICCSLPTSPVRKPMIFLFGSLPFSNRLIPVFSIFKKQKRRQENHRFNLRLKEFVQEQWPCSEARNWEMWQKYYLNKCRNWEFMHGLPGLMSGRKGMTPISTGQLIRLEDSWN